MTRKEFLAKLGVGATFALTVPCLSGCTKDAAAEPRDVDFIIDLNDPAYASLTATGEFVIDQGIVIARSIDGEIIAATVKCSHEGFDEIIYNDGEWFCTRHGARFSEDGEGLNNFGSNGLTIYQIEDLGNDQYRIFS